MPINAVSWVQNVFERLVYLKDWIAAEDCNQHVPQQASSSEAETEESGTEARHEAGQANSDSDGAEESEQWYRNASF